MSTSTDFTGEVAVVTGAGAGLGAALAGRAAARGMDVVLTDIDGEAVERQAALLRGEGFRATAIQVDVASATDVLELTETVYADRDHVALLINNAGVETHGLAWEISAERWWQVLGVNLGGVVHHVRSFLPRMLQSGRTAHVVNVASVSALGIAPYTAPYRTSKHACLALSEIIAAEVAAITDKVHVSAVIPGSVRTEIFARSISSDSDGPGARARSRMLESNARNGMDPRLAAEIILEGTCRRMSLIYTHPQTSRDLIEERFVELLRDLDDSVTLVQHAREVLGDTDDRITTTTRGR